MQRNIKHIMIPMPRIIDAIMARMIGEAQQDDLQRTNASERSLLAET